MGMGVCHSLGRSETLQARSGAGMLQTWGWGLVLLRLPTVVASSIPCSLGCRLQSGFANKWV